MGILRRPKQRTARSELRQTASRGIEVRLDDELVSYEHAR
jgi:hypothetical protein